MQKISSVHAFIFSENAKEKPQLSKEDKSIKEFLEYQYNNRFQFGTDNLISSGHYRLLGWAFNFTPHLTKYVYKQYGQWHEAYAPNKTLLRKVIGGKIDKIIDIN